MVWIQFFLSSAIIVFAAVKLSEYGDIISVRTRLSGMFVGTLLLAGATSLPELLSSVNAVYQGIPGMAAGSMFGSNMFNMLMLAILDLIYQNARILRRVAMNHALTASLATLLVGAAVFFVLADINLSIGWVGVDSLMIIAVYVVGMRVIQTQGGPPPMEIAVEDTKIPSLKRAGIGFVIATIVLLVVVPFLVDSVLQIGDITGLSTGFIGATLLAFVTSLPELVATMAAVRIGAYDLAIGNLFGSNFFNMLAFGLTDIFYLQGRFIGLIDPSFALIGLLGLLLTSMGLIGNLLRVERRLGFLEVDALLILAAYFAGMWFLYMRGIGV
jgi:cation:H+ antiporter